MAAQDCVRRLETDAKAGLSRTQAERRLREAGRNELEGGKRRGPAARFFSQFTDFMVLVLLAAAGLSFAAAWLEGNGDWVDPVMILLIVVINAAAGAAQEGRAERAMEALRRMSSPKARVVRGGREQQIDAALLAPGDVVRLTAGDVVPADLRLIETNGLQAGESALTGESLPVEKDAAAVLPADTPAGDRRNMIYSPAEVTAGSGLGVVTATGMQTEVGRIAGLIQSQEAPKTPLQKRLAQTGRWLGAAALLLCAVIFVMGLAEHMEPLEMFLLSISLAVAAIPEGLPAVVTIVLAVGMRRMAARRAIIRRLPAVETLGSASVICSDKTGTLTENRMTVRVIATAAGEDSPRAKSGRELLRMAALCTNCTGARGRYRGEPTETALAEACQEEKAELDRAWPRVQELPFSSERKRMTTVHRRPGGGYRVICKGAPDVIARCCSGSCAVFLKRNESMASRALRVIGVAYKDVPSLPAGGELERGLTFAGLVGMSDPPRAGVKEAVAQCRAAGIRPVLITGDHAATAAAVAREVGILPEDGAVPEGAVLTGRELDAMNGVDLRRAARTCRVFARVSPEHKVRIVRAFQENGEVAAMTGDGVNDAPALRAADIGCAMGRGGTEVAKAAADMVLADDNFATIVAAVREGRGVYANIRRTVRFPALVQHGRAAHRVCRIPDGPARAAAGDPAFVGEPCHGFASGAGAGCGADRGRRDAPSAAEARGRAVFRRHGLADRSGRLSHRRVFAGGVLRGPRLFRRRPVEPGDWPHDGVCRFGARADCAHVQHARRAARAGRAQGEPPAARGGAVHGDAVWCDCVSACGGAVRGAAAQCGAMAGGGGVFAGPGCRGAAGEPAGGTGAETIKPHTAQTAKFLVKLFSKSLQGAVCQWHANERRSHLPIRSVLPVCHWQTAPEPAGETAGTAPPFMQRCARRSAPCEAEKDRAIQKQRSDFLAAPVHKAPPNRQKSERKFCLFGGVFLRPVRRSVCRGWPLLHELYELLSGFRARVSRRFSASAACAGMAAATVCAVFCRHAFFPGLRAVCRFFALAAGLPGAHNPPLAGQAACIVQYSQMQNGAKSGGPRNLLTACAVFRREKRKRGKEHVRAGARGR